MDEPAGPDLTQQIDAVEQNEREHRAGAGQDQAPDRSAPRTDPGQQRPSDEERRNPGQQTGGTSGVGTGKS